MKFLTTRVLRNRPSYVREATREEDLVLTSNGKPFAILVGVEESTFEETARAIKRAKAQVAVSRMQRQAAKKGLNRMSLAAVNKEIRAVRSKRQRT
jgi:prevent-host-death family protein